MNVSSIAEKLFFTTVRIETVTGAGSQGSGTGFFFSYQHGEQDFPFVVTSRHVVNGMRSGALSFLHGSGDQPTLGSGFRLEILEWQDLWFGHPSPDVDIAICPLAPLVVHMKQQSSVDLFYRFVTTDMVPNQEQLEKMDALESVTFVGYPNGIWDKVNLIPVARRGTTASPPAIDFENTPRFLIDASVFGGSSGSPVFLFNQGMYCDKSGATTFGSRCLFLGVVAAVFFRTQLNQIVSVPVPTQARPMAEQQEMIDLGIVFKARTVVETIEAFLKTKGAI